MRLILNNFIRVTRYEFESPDDGLVLLKGDSGAGKTTILKAIVYALWGRIPSQGKIKTFDAKRAYVKLEYKDLVIERWTNPKELQLTIVNGREPCNDETVFKDKEAQNHIKETIGFGEEVFGYSSWVPQKSSSSILTETPARQLEIIKTLSLGPYTSQLRSMHSFLKRTILALSTNLERTRGKLEAQRLELNKLSHPQIPEITESKLETLIKSLKKLRERHTTLEKHKLEMVQQLGTLQERSKRGKTVKLEISQLKGDLSRIGEELREMYQKMWDEDKYSSFETKLERSREEVEYHSVKQWREEIDKNYKRIRDELARFGDIFDSERVTTSDVNDAKEESDSVSLEIDDVLLQSSIIRGWTTFLEKAHNYKKGKCSTPKIVRGKLAQLQTKVRDGITDGSKALEQDINEDYMECPECGVDLSVGEGGKLQKATPLTPDERSTLEKQVKQFRKHERVLSSLLLDSIWSTANLDDTVRVDIGQLDETIAELQERKDLASSRYEQLTFELGASNEKRLKRSNLEKELDRLTKEHKKERYKKWIKWESQFKSVKEAQSYNEKQEGRVNEQVQLQTEYDTKTDIHAEKLEKKRKLKKELTEMESPSRTLTNGPSTLESVLEECEERYAEVTADCEKTNERRIAREKRINKITDEYTKYKELKKKFDEVEESVHTSKTCAAKLEEDIKEWELLLEYIKSSERDAVEATMALFNRCIGEFLALMFTGENMVPTVYLEWGEKQKIKTRYWYQEYEYSNIREFSGGEQDRLLLASILTWNSIYESSFLFLDESLSSLDGTNNTNILISLRDTFQRLNDRKLILVCSHEALTGVFDHIHFLESD